MVFKHNLRIPKDRADGSSGFVKVKRGDTPEEHGFTPEQVKELGPLLMDGEGVTAPKAEDEMTSTEFYEKIHRVIKASLKADPEKQNSGIWTKAGIPRVDYLEAMTSMEITETERDIAWDDFEEGDNK